MGSAQVQGELWGSAARDWVEFQEPTATPLWEAMLNAAQVGPGTRFLDAGCGSGGACVLAAKRDARVSGLDASEALISIARERVTGGDFRVGDLELLPYEDGIFDTIIACNSIQYAADPNAALRELRRVCASNGRAVVATWGAPEHCEARDILKAVRDVLPSPPSGGGPFALSAPGALESLVEQNGWNVVGDGEAECPFEYSDLEAAWRGNRSAGPIQAAIRAVGEGKVQSAVTKALEPYQNSDGSVRLQNRFRFVMATP